MSTPTFSYYWDQELMMLHSTVIALNGGLLTLDTAAQNAPQNVARDPETALKPVRDATTYCISLIHNLYPFIMSLRGSVQVLRDAGW
ncbi:hypothetical protein TGAMA5MH_10632 [Trichoderma gamsii]|uniref:Uncharacterized protein n=1 Tax=Trichoderma gamsii TaxID=398673 RepID=A0A2K0SW68_9HYPO|nr:hypothetical protein TGAMA5MH_10632 [Trichoderma gamsii]